MSLDESIFVAAGRPVEVEIGCGKARFLIARAEAMPHIRFVGVERVSKWARVAARRTEQRGLTNLRIVKADAREVINDHIPSTNTSIFHINFPDPWPKRRHRKRRLLNASFLELLHDRLTPGGRVEFNTDFENYAGEVRKIVARQRALWKHQRFSVNAPFMQNAEKTNYEMKYVTAGRPIYYQEFEK